jgi:RNA polymerase sigma-70 factor (ECF subfamily)
MIRIKITLLVSVLTFLSMDSTHAKSPGIHKESEWVRLYHHSPIHLRQEIIYQAWKAFENFRGDSKFSTWFYRVALNTALTHNRRDKLDQTYETLPESHSNLSPNAQSKELLIQHIRAFNDGEKLIIMLHLDGYSHDEISALAGLSKNHVAVKLHRLKERLSKSIKEQES